MSKKNTDIRTSNEKHTNRPVEARPFSISLPTHGGADQSHRDSTNINSIIAAFSATGAQPPLSAQQGHYGDFVAAPDLHEAYEAVYRSEQAFAELPAEVRAAALNNPIQFIEMLDDPYGRELLSSAGLVLDEVPDQAGAKPSSQAPPEAAPAAAPPATEPPPGGAKDTPLT